MYQQHGNTATTVESQESTQYTSEMHQSAVFSDFLTAEFREHCGFHFSPEGRALIVGFETLTHFQIAVKRKKPYRARFFFFFFSSILWKMALVAARQL